MTPDCTYWVGARKRKRGNSMLKDVATKLNVKPGDIAMNLRVAMTGRTNTPDLYSVMQVLGGKRVIERINMIL